MTTEGAAKTDAWAQENGCETAYAYDTNSELFRYFGIRGIPHAVLLDPNGTVVWRGNPAGLREATIRQALEGALTTPMWEWPKEAEPVARGLKADQLAKALAAAEKLEGPYADVVRARITGRVEAVERARDAGDYRAALELGEATTKALAGLPEREEVEQLLAEISKDPEVQRVLGGQKKLEELLAEVRGTTARKKQRRLLEDVEELATQYEGTIVARKARQAISELGGRRR